MALNEEYVRLEAIVGTETFNISSRVKYIHISNDGFGVSPVTRFTEQGPLQHGETDRGFLLKPRIVNLVLNMVASDRKTYWLNREELGYIFLPRATPIKLRFTYRYVDPINPDPNQESGETNMVKKVRQLDCYISGGLTFPGADKQGNFNGHRVAVELTAPNPCFYNPTVQAVAIGDDLAYIANFNENAPFTYKGNFRAYPVIEIRGPATDLVLTNTVTGDKLDFTGYTVPTSEGGAQEGIITVDCRYGYKTVKDGTGLNLIDKLTADSDLSTFSIEAKPEVTAGLNNYFAAASDLSGTYSRVTINWYEQYASV